MLVHIHGFDWMSYTQKIMPAFARWIIDEEEQEIYQLYQETRLAREDRFVPEAILPLCAWPRAKDFVHQLPRGAFARQEYQKLCITTQFLLLSDRYVFRHPPQLYRDCEPLRSVWGATVEQHCLPWYQELQQSRGELSEKHIPPSNELATPRNELLNLLQTAGLHDLAQEVNAQVLVHGQAQQDEETTTFHETHASEEERAAETEDEKDDISDGPEGIFIGRLPTTLHLRGWLATQSLRAMIFFEYLACGRRAMPFGSQEGDPFGSYIGYLTPEEVLLLLNSLKHVQPPNQNEAEKEYQAFRLQQDPHAPSSRLIDEILPAHAHEFLQAVYSAADQNLGLICTIG